MLAGCASTPYKDEAAQVGASASALASAFAPPDPYATEGPDTLDLTTDLVMLNGPIRYTSDCGDKAFEAYGAFRASIARSQDAEDETYAALMKLPACGIDMLQPPAADVAPAAAARRKAPRPAGAASAAALAAEARLARAEARQAARDAQRRTPGRTPPRVTCLGSCRLGDYAREIKAYGDAIQAAAEAKDVADAQAAAGKADTAIDNLLKAAKAPPLAAPIVDLVAALGKMALQQAQYAAMKHAVLSFDRAWQEAAPAVASAARLEQSHLISLRADRLAAAAMSAQLYVNDDRFYHSPAERLQLFTSLQAKVDDAAHALKAATIDPGAAVAAFGRANHALALAMMDPKRQKPTLVADLKALQDQITAIQKAAAPAKASGGSNG
jgi:hypothetical protein